MMSKLWAALSAAWVRVFGPKRDDPKRAPQPPAQAGPKRDDPK
jgi:hypothetical protein